MVTWVKFDFDEISGTQAMRGTEDLAKLQRYLASLILHLSPYNTPTAALSSGWMDGLDAEWSPRAHRQQMDGWVGHYNGYSPLSTLEK
jgi:hypothetical protein